MRLQWQELSANTIRTIILPVGYPSSIQIWMVFFPSDKISWIFLFWKITNNFTFWTMEFIWLVLTLTSSSRYSHLNSIYCIFMSPIWNKQIFYQLGRHYSDIIQTSDFLFHTETITLSFDSDVRHAYDKNELFFRL